MFFKISFFFLKSRLGRPRSATPLNFADFALVSEEDEILNKNKFTEQIEHQQEIFSFLYMAMS